MTRFHRRHPRLWALSQVAISAAFTLAVEGAIVVALADNGSVGADDMPGIWHQNAEHDLTKAANPAAQADGINDLVGLILMDRIINNHVELDTLAPQIEKEVRGSVGAPYACFEQYHCVIAVGLGALLQATTMEYTVGIGRCAGASLQTESRDLLIGDYTSAPKGADGFVNLNNQLCWWRDTGKSADCPPPEPECFNSKDHP